MNNSSQLKWGSLLSYVQMGVAIILGLLYTPVMIRLLGQSEYGLYNTVSSTISMLSILNLGFNSGYIKFFSRYKKENDYIKIYRLNGLFLLIFFVLGLIGLVCGVYLSFNMRLVFKTGLIDREYQIARVLMLLLTVNLAVSFPMSVFQNIISANEKYVFLKLIGMIKTVLGPLVTLPLLLLGYKSIAMVVVTVTVNLIADSIFFYYVKYKLHYKFIFKGYEKGVLIELSSFTIFIAINMIIDQINWNIDKLLLTRYKGTVAVAIYSVGYSLYQYYHMFSTSISSVFTPRIHKISNVYADNILERNKQFTALFIKVGRIQFLLLSLVASGIVLFGKPFIYFWAGDGYSESYYVAVLLVLSASIALVQNLGIEIQRAENLHKFRSIAYSIMAIVNLIASIYLCQLYGPIGSAIGTAASLVIANGLIMNLYYYKRCGIDVLAFWKNIIRQSVGLIIPISVGLVINHYFVFRSFAKLILFIVIYSVVFAVSMFFISMNQFEKDLVTSPIRKICRKNIG